MAEKDPNKLYNGIKSLQDDLESIRTLVDQIVENSKTLMNDANGFGGVIAKVFKEQMAKYFVPGVQKIAEPIDNLVSGDRVPGSLKDLTIFLDSVPLAMIRQEPSVTELASPVVPKNVNLDTPAGKVTSEVDEIPQNQSYATEDAPIEESKKKPSVSEKLTEAEKKEEEDDGTPGIWQVRRVSGIGSSLGEDIANIEPQVVCEFDCKECAEERKEELEKSILPEEKELLGTSYDIHKVPLKKDAE